MVVTILLVAVIAVVTFIPKIAVAFNDTDKPANETKPIMLLAADASVDATDIENAIKDGLKNYDVKIVSDPIDDVKNKIISEDAECAVVLTSPTSYSYYVKNLSMYDENTTEIDSILQNAYRKTAMVDGGITDSKANEILEAKITNTTESLGKDQAQNFFYTYIMIFALYMVILLYGQMVATNVATEKSSRAMELLITSAKPTAMMFGKVIASCLAGLIQLVCVFGSAILFFNLNKDAWGNNFLINSIFNMPVDMLIYMIVFFILGFFIYAFMYGAVGSTASKVEDINTSVMPITLIFIAAFMVVMFSMIGNNVDNLAMVICSYIPFTSPMAMFTRIAMSTVPVYEIVISIAILIASVIGIGVLSAKIYRVGVLLYGTPPKIGTILKSIRKARV